MIALANAGPAACIMIGRNMPSIPLAASSSSAGSTDGSNAEYAG